MDNLHANNEILKDGPGNETETAKKALLEDNSKSYIKENSHPNEETNSSLLQKKLEKKIEQARRTNIINQKPAPALLPLKRVPVPIKKSSSKNDIILVWDSDSENEIIVEDNEVNQQLLPEQHGVITDDEDLDLILPETFTKRCICCFRLGTSCIIQ